MIFALLTISIKLVVISLLFFNVSGEMIANANGFSLSDEMTFDNFIPMIAIPVLGLALGVYSIHLLIKLWRIE